MRRTIIRGTAKYTTVIACAAMAGLALGWVGEARRERPLASRVIRT